MTAPKKPAPPKWRELIALEPMLAQLLTEAKAVRATDPEFCANEVWYDQLKPRLSRLVGWGARECAAPRLKTCEAYDVAYDTIYDALPDCRHEGALCP